MGFALAALVTTCIACEDEATGDGGGSVRFVVSGEGAAKEGYPFVKDGVEIRFVDGWSLAFERYLVSFGDIELASRGIEPVSSGLTFVADLHQGDPEVELFENLEARRWEQLGFSMVRASAASERLAGVAPEQADAFAASGAVYEMAGTATHPDKGEIRFDWRFDIPARNRSCTNGADGTDGVIVRDNATSQVEITFHVDHVFWDTLGSEIAVLRFDAIWGADKDQDGVVTLDELAAQRIAAPTDPSGAPLLDESSGPLVYNPGSIPLPDRNLLEFMNVSASSQVHVNGLGLCSLQAL